VLKGWKRGTEMDQGWNQQLQVYFEGVFRREGRGGMEG